MNIFRHKLLKSSWTSPTFVLGRLIPGAYGVFVAGFVISAGVFSADRTLTLEDGIMSDLLSRKDNPHGYLISAIATMICGGLLLPAANLFQRGWKGSPRGWVVLGAWLYRLGLIAAIAVGVTTPLQQPYISFHIWLSYLAFMSMVAGLGVSLEVAAYSSTSARIPLAVLGVFQIGTLLFLVHLFFSPSYFEGRRWLLAVYEWALSALIAAGTIAQAAALVRAKNDRAN
ncbi:MAG: hypothetical protein ACYTFU_11865 [Planctomycetota bacterium]|jgi:hypothetical protein